MREGITALGIQCASLRLAIPDGWTTMVVDEFETAHVPLAPAWLLGLANVDGEILPLIDLARYFSPDSPPAARQATRLLIGRGAAEGDHVALQFSGLPVNLRGPRDTTAPAHLPARMEPVFRGQLLGGDGHTYLEIDCAGVMNAMAAQL